jgi:hypothetical protein
VAVPVWVHPLVVKPQDLSYRGHVLGELPNWATLVRLLVSSCVVEQFRLEFSNSVEFRLHCVLPTT